MKITYVGENEAPVTLVCPHTGFSYTAKKGEAIDVAEITGISATHGPLWKAVSEPAPHSKNTTKESK